jgi:hypothetical protein
MLSLSASLELKEAGLTWTPALHDFFAIPDRGLDDRVFVISDIQVNVQTLSGHLSATFHGTVEWALDHVVVDELVWLPTEEQLREDLEGRLVTRSGVGVKLISTPDGYVCEIQVGDRPLRFEAFDASAAYAAALMYVLEADR